MDKVYLYIIDRYVIIALFLLLPILLYVGFTGAFTVISLLFIVIFLSYAKNSDMRQISVSYPLVLWFILTIYQWGNAMDKHVPEVDFLDLIHGLKIFSCIAIFSYLARRNFNQTIKSLLICFTLYFLLSFVVNSTSDPQFEGRFTGVMFATALGQTAALSGIYIAYYTVKNNISLTKTVLMYVLPVIIILLTQSRNSLAMLAVGIIGHAIAASAKKGVKLSKTLLTILVLGGVAYAFFSILVNNTDLGARLSDTETAEKMNDNNNLKTNTAFDDIAGDRLVYYVLGWKYLMDSPWTGIGMWNFMYVSGGDYPLHSEYMVQLAEGGIIGASLWLLFIIAVFRGILRSQQPQYIKIIAFFSIAEILFCGIYARVFYYEFFYPIFGIAISLYGKNFKYQPVGKNVLANS